MTLTKAKLAISFYALAALSLVSFITVGCVADRFIPVSVPKGIQAEINVPSTVPLREAPHVREQYAMKVAQNVESLDWNIADANDILALFSVGAQFGLASAEAAAGTVPGGALVVGGLTTLAALFTRRPGDRAQADVSKEKERSYAKGAEDAERKLKDQLEAIGISLAERAAQRATDRLVDKTINVVTRAAP
jgi:hypothetical protein